MEMERQGEHRRRPRYKGTHPRTFQEKYKEHQPEKYAETIEKVRRKGSTPAGMHIPIMVKEILEALRISPGERGLDATLGYGGHSRELLKALGGTGCLVALDIDPIESVKTEERLRREGFSEELLIVRRINFARIDEVARELGRFDFVLADLGVSSMQIDNPARGFSYKQEGPLDLRLNPQSGISAAERLRQVSQEELAGMLRENADEPYAQEIARAVIRERRRGHRIETTTQLRAVIELALESVPEREKREAVKKACQRTFQALRIDVNSEFEVLEEFLEKLPAALQPGARVAILTFHSGEDRLVKKAFRRGREEGLYREIAGEVIRPSREECAQNPRATSTKLRWAIRS